MSNVTILYNHLGFTGARAVFDRLQTYLGAYRFPLPPPVTAFVPASQQGDDVKKQARPGDALQECFDANMRIGFAKHGHVRELMKHCPMVDFVVKVRNFFLNTFEEHRDDFLGIDAEALFAGSIIHSLDHCSFHAATHAPQNGGIVGIRSGCRSVLSLEKKPNSGGIRFDFDEMLAGFRNSI